MAQVTYDILIFEGVGNPDYLDANLITIKPEDSYWSPEELALGKLKKLKFKDGEYDTASLAVLDYCVDNINNPTKINKVK